MCLRVLESERELGLHRVEGRVFQTEETIRAKVLRRKKALRMFQKLNSSPCGWKEQTAAGRGRARLQGL